MPYLNLDVDFFDHPKTRRLIGLLGKGSEAVPLRVWAYVGKYHAADGKLADYSAQEIETIVGWWGTAGRMVDALIQVGFLHQVDGGYQVHDWLEHEGHIVVFQKRARTAAQARWKDAASRNATSSTSSNANVFLTSRTPIVEGPAEDVSFKSKLEVVDFNRKARDATSNALALPYLLKRKDLKEVGPIVSGNDRTLLLDPIAELKALTCYSGIDVEKEHQKMVVWCRAHKKKPTKRRFIAWLNRIDGDSLPVNKKSGGGDARLELLRRDKKTGEGISEGTPPGDIRTLLGDA